MKYILALSALLFLNGCSNFSFFQKNTPSENSFNDFITMYQLAVDNRDLEYIHKTTLPDISYSFGETGDGSNDQRSLFFKYHNLTKNNKNSTFWVEMEKILKMGCGKTEHASYNCPKVFINWPEALDPYTTLIVLADDLEIYSKSNEKSEIVGSLKKGSYIELLEYGEKWSHIKSPQGIEGYVKRDSTRSPLDYRASFISVNGKWYLESFVSGD